MDLETVIAHLRTLNEPVPRPRRLPTENEVDAAEARLGLIFTPDYRSFLLRASDVVYGTIEPATVTTNAGYLDLVDMATEAWNLGVPEAWLPFCESDGDYFCLDSEGRVLLWSEDGPTDESWPDLAHWIQAVWLDE
jgi:hypothetical protein